MDRRLTFLGGIGVGAGWMYYGDPQMGHGRRARLRDRLTRLYHDSCDACGMGLRDLGHRAQGVLAETRGRVFGRTADDRTLAERVRAAIGHVISHPGAVTVSAEGGRVTLTGPVLAAEADALRRSAAGTRGVRAVEDRLEVHEAPGRVPGLQGVGHRPARAEGSPATRLLLYAAGGGLFAWGLTQRAPTACVLGTVGLALAAAGAGEAAAARRGRPGRREDVQKTITIDAPVERVFPFWADYKAFPRFMAHLREVRDLGGGRSHWVAVGPAGAPVAWDAVVTRRIPNREIAWESAPGAVVENCGVVRFEPAAGDKTRIHIRLCYNPPGGALGRFAASLFGADPASSIDDDLVRFKSLIEEGATRAPGKGLVARQDVTGGRAVPPEPAL